MASIKACTAMLLAVSIMLSAGAPGAQPAGPAGADGIRELVARAASAVPGSVHPYEPAGWLERFYGPRGYQPAWNQAQASEAIGLLRNAAVHGLEPADYHADALQSGHSGSAGAARARFDVALTAAMLHFLADLRMGRVRSEYYGGARHAAPIDPAALLQRALDGGGLAQAVAAAEPGLPLYRGTRAALERYRQLAGQTLPALAPLPGRRALAPGDPYRGAAALRERLVLLGDLAPDAATPEGQVYTHALADGVRRFQARHGLDQDGLAGPATMAALEVPLAVRARQLALTMERLRWLPPFPPGPAIMVNIPAYTLWTWRVGESAEPVDMRVIVGKAVETPTPLFIGQMRYLEFNPYWNVPRSITLKEILPKLERNRAWLAQNDMELVGMGRVSTAVNGSAMAALRSGKLRVRQRPGPKNALGAVKFAMPNPHDIYLHSTPARELFQRARRDLSHGCIRVERPAELAYFVLRGQPGWTLDAVHAAMEPGPTFKVDLAAPVPVVILYATAVPSRQGEPHFARDIYARDARLERALATHSAAVRAQIVPASTAATE